jgi:hypothetical protein
MTELTFDRDNVINPSLQITLHPKRGRIIVTMSTRWDEENVTLETHEVKDLYNWLGKVLEGQQPKV